MARDVKHGRGMRPTLLLLSFAVLAPACATVAGDGNVTTAQRDVGPFHAVEAHGAVRVDLTVGSPARVEVRTDSNLQSKVHTDVTGGTLIIRTEGDIDATGTITVTIVTEALDKVDLSGACQLELRGATGPRLQLEASGASEVHLAGRVTALEIDASGASEIEAGDLIADTVSIEASGASEVEVHARTSLDVDASGASNVEQRGPGRIRRAESSGASRIETTWTATTTAR